MPANLENSAVATGRGNLSFNYNPKKGQCKGYTNYHKITIISIASKVIFNILQLGFNITWTKNFQVNKLDLENGEKPEMKLPTSTES